jgi:hypothetical protein
MGKYAFGFGRKFSKKYEKQTKGVFMKVCQCIVKMSCVVYEIYKTAQQKNGKTVYFFPVWFYCNYGETDNCKCWMEVRTYEKPQIFVGQELNIWGTISSRHLSDGRIRHFIFAEKIEPIQTLDEFNKMFDAKIAEFNAGVK